MCKFLCAQALVLKVSGGNEHTFWKLCIRCVCNHWFMNSSAEIFHNSWKIWICCVHKQWFLKIGFCRVWSELLEDVYLLCIITPLKGFFQRFNNCWKMCFVLCTIIGF